QLWIFFQMGILYLNSIRYGNVVTIQYCNKLPIGFFPTPISGKSDSFIAFIVYEPDPEIAVAVDNDFGGISGAIIDNQQFQILKCLVKDTFNGSIKISSAIINCHGNRYFRPFHNLIQLG